MYQMGKVGSSTVKASLRAAMPERIIYHVHALTEPELAFAEETFRENWSERPANPHTLWESQHLLETLRSSDRAAESRQIVTLVRDPIARNVSAFFEIMDVQLGFGYEERLRAVGLTEVVGELERFFWEEFPDHDLPLRWFDDQIKGVFGIDVFERPFDRARGYDIYENDAGVRLLVLKLERLSECVGAAMKEFLGLETFELVPKNVGEEKYYTDAYRRFLERVTVPEPYLDRMYGSRLARHFYEPEELAELRSGWSRCAD